MSVAKRLRMAKAIPVGIKWTSTNSKFSFGIEAGCWNGTSFIVVGSSGKVALSTDGVTWTENSGLAATAYGSVTSRAVAWDGSQFCVTGAAGQCATSPDGITWTNRTSLSVGGWGGTQSQHLAWNGSVFIVVGASGKVATSPDGITWTNQTGLSSTTWGTNIVNQVHWNGSQFLAVGGGGHYATSPDGVTWTYRGAVVNGSSLLSIAWDGVNYVVGASTGRVFRSTNNGVTFSLTLTLPDMTSNWEIVWVGTHYVIMGQASTGSRAGAWTSRNGIAWVRRYSITQFAWSPSFPFTNASVWNGTTLIVAGNNGHLSVSS